MSDAPTSLRHTETPNATDTALAQESRSHVANNRALQLIAELILKLRGSRFSWWTPELLRGTWGANERMGWFDQRPDIRQRITCSLTGLKPKASRNKQPDFQAALIDSVIDDGDVTVDQFENAFDATAFAAYAPAAEIWHRFRERMPWDQDIQQNQELVGWLIERLLASSSTIEGMTRKPILSAHAIRTAISGKMWHSKIPLEIRVAIDDLRLHRELAKPGEPFHAIHDLSVATPRIIAANIPLRELLRVLDVAEKAMGLPSSRGLAATPLPPKVEEAARAEPPKGDVKVQPAVLDVTEKAMGLPSSRGLAATPLPPKVEEAARAEPPKGDVKVQPAVLDVTEKAMGLPSSRGLAATPLPPKVEEAAKAEPSKAGVKVQAPAPPAEKLPEKPAEKPIEKPAERWERMADKVLEKVGKEAGNAEEPWGQTSKEADFLRRR